MSSSYFAHAGARLLAGDRKDREAVFAQFGRYGQEKGGTFKAELLHVLADDEGRVVGIHHNSAARGASAWMLTAASSLRSRTAGLLTVGSTFTTSTRGTSSGRSPAELVDATARPGRGFLVSGGRSVVGGVRLLSIWDES